MSDEKRQFMYVLKPVRPTLLEDMTEAEARVAADHAAYVERLRDEGVVILAGRTDGAEMGIVVFEAVAAAAHAIVADDPAVRNGLMTADLYPYRIAYFRDYRRA